MPVTIKDIARALNISPATVSLALNNSPMVNVDTAKKVRDMAERMGYTPNAFARGLARGRSGFIAFIVPELSDYYFATLVKLTALRAKAEGYDLSIYISNRSVAEERKLLNKAVQQSAEAIILAPADTSFADGEYMEWLGTVKAPIVFAASRYPGIDFPCAMSDLFGGIADMTRHMLAKGCSRVALLSVLEGSYTYGICEKGYASAMRERGLEKRILRIGENDYESAYELTLNLADLPDAFVCVSDYTALGVENALLKRGIAVPENIMISGFGEAAYSNVSPVPLTTMRRNLREIAKSLIDLCRTRIERPGEPARDMIIPCELVARASTDFSRE